MHISHFSPMSGRTLNAHERHMNSKHFSIHEPTREPVIPPFLALQSCVSTLLQDFKIRLGPAVGHGRPRCVRSLSDCTALPAHVTRLPANIYGSGCWGLRIQLRRSLYLFNYFAFQFIGFLTILFHLPPRCPSLRNASLSRTFSLRPRHWASKSSYSIHGTTNSTMTLRS